VLGVAERIRWRLGQRLRRFEVRGARAAPSRSARSNGVGR
jgi:hypothetical protein